MKHTSEPLTDSNFFAAGNGNDRNFHFEESFQVSQSITALGRHDGNVHCRQRGGKLG